MSGQKKLALVGFGTVGSGVYEVMKAEARKIERLAGSFSIPLVIVKDIQRSRNVEPDTQVTDDIEELFKQNIDTVVEVSPDAETAYPVVRRLLKKGITVVTANKELVALHGEELLYISAIHNARLYFEAAVAGGIPALTSIRHTLKTNKIERIEGIVNGTSNFILTKMRQEGTSFEAALEEAQELGYAEAVPDKDVDGWDAWYKTVILSQWIHGKNPDWSEEKPRGIRGIDVRDLHLASSFSGRIKHTAVLKGTAASVAPRFVEADHALYGVEGVNNGLNVQGSIAGSLLFQGAGAGKYPTASAVIEDVINHWTNTAEAEPPVSDDEPERTSGEPEPFPYWFITGTGLERLEGKVSDIHTEHGREGVFVQGEEKQFYKDGLRVYAVSGNLKAGVQIKKQAVCS
ncbi:MAG: homoserine dehydrogenase [Alkalicoccus sp.]|nr:MAG: homoserine dehydrogenase [Alkalicoccus sp.]